MTTKQEELKTIDGKKVCWNFRKGRCRFGHTCSFAHDNDVKSANKIISGDVPTKVPTKVPTTPQVRYNNDKRVDLDERNSNYDECAVISKHKQKRPGLSDDIMPSKKAAKFHNKVYNK